jgi:hypothetical protein
MCPEKERYMRETRNQLSCFELVPETEMVRERWVSRPLMITVWWVNALRLNPLSLLNQKSPP